MIAPRILKLVQEKGEWLIRGEQFVIFAIVMDVAALRELTTKGNRAGFYILLHCRKSKSPSRVLRN